MVLGKYGKEGWGVGMSAGLERAAALLPEHLRGELLFLEEGLLGRTEEIRLRCGGCLCLTLEEGPLVLGGRVTREDLETVLERASRSSLHTALEGLRSGYLTAPGGCRVGVCGSMVTRAGQPEACRSVSSLCIRVPRQKRCVTPEMLEELRDCSVLILSPPGGGKTTFLRDLVRLLSDSGRRVGLVDERGELAAMEGGIPGFDVGRNTDVLENCPKAQAVEMLLRGMSPQVIAMDELGAGDGEALRRARDSGVNICASLHSTGPEALGRKGLPEGIFDRTVQIGRDGGKRIYRTEALAAC